MALSLQQVASILTRQSTPPLASVAIARPRCHLLPQGPEVASWVTSQALADHRVEFVIRDVPSAAALRRVAQLDPTRQLVRPRRLERGAERSLRIRAETVKHQRDPLACSAATSGARFGFSGIGCTNAATLHCVLQGPETRTGFRPESFGPPDRA